MGTFIYRAMGAAALNAAMYETIERDRPATGQALVVVLLSSLAAGIGAGGLAGPSAQVLALAASAALISWLAWASLILYVGKHVMPESETRVSYSELLRTIGFAAAPGVMMAFGAFETIRTTAFILAWIWMLAAMVVAVRAALDFKSLWHAFGVCLVTFSAVVATALLVRLAFQQTVA